MIATAEKTLRVMPCQIGGLTFAIGLDQLRSLHAGDHLEPDDDGTPLAGHIATRAGRVPVYRLADLIGMESVEPQPASQIVLFKGRTQAWGILVDRISPAWDVLPEGIFPLPICLRESSPCFQAVLRVETGPVMLLAPEKIDPHADGAGSGEQWIGELSVRNETDLLEGLPSSAVRSGQLLLARCHDFDANSRPISLGIAIASIREILELPKLSPAPGAPPHVLGLTIWRQAVIPVIDPARRLGMDAPAIDRHSRLMVVQQGRQLAGFLVRGDIQTIRLPIAHTACERELTIDSEFVHSVIELLETTVVLPKLERFLE